MKVCQIGLGHWGKNHARILADFKKEGIIDELYLYDVNSELLEKTSKYLNCVAVKDFSNLDVDAVDIVVPANLHYKIAKPFVERGINTFIEKPITDDINDAIELEKISLRPEEKIMVGHIFRFHEGVIKAKEFINNSMIGQLKKIEIIRSTFAKPRADNGVILSLAIHDLDLFKYFNNEEYPISIKSLHSKTIGPTEDIAFIQAKFKNSVGYALESWMTNQNIKTRSCSIQGTEGFIQFDFSNPQQITINNKYIGETVVNDGEFNHLLPFSEPLKNELIHFISQTEISKPYKVGPKISIDALKMSLMALENDL